MIFSETLVWNIPHSNQN